MKIDITRTESIAMRAIAILLIAMHNFCHSTNMFVLENEGTFYVDRPEEFFRRLSNGSETLLGDFFSFYGWYGVPVFMFLSGYGIVKKYEQQNMVKIHQEKYFLQSNFMKMFKLLLPATLLLILIHVSSGHLNIKYVGMLLFQQTFLNDFVYIWIPPYPGVYWYFGLTLQLYALYWITQHNCSNKSGNICLVICVVLSFLIQVMALPADWNNESQVYLRYVRHNCVGWVAPFALGIYMARNNFKKYCSVFSIILIVLLAIVVMITCIFNGILWQLTPLAAILIIYVVGKLLVNVPVISTALIWIGGYASYIFVVHPLVRTYLLDYAMDDPAPYVTFGVYMMLVVLFAVIYKVVSTKFYFFIKL